MSVTEERPQSGNAEQAEARPDRSAPGEERMRPDDGERQTAGVPDGGKLGGEAPPAH